MYHKLIPVVLLIILSTANTFADHTITIEEAVNIALSSHPSISSSKAAVEEAKGRLLSELSPDPPQIAWEYEGAPSGSKLADYEEKRLTLSQELEFPLKTYLRYNQGKTALNRRKYELSVVRLDLEALVRELYIEAWEKSEIEAILAQNFEAVSEYADNIQKAFEFGEASLFDAQRAKVEALSARQLSESAKVEKTVAVDNLIRFIGFESNAISLENPLDKTAFNEVDRAYPAEASENPGLKLADYDTKIAGYENKRTYLNWLPDFEISYFQQTVPAENDPDYWGMEFGINIPLWFWLGQRGEMKSSKARMRIVEAEYHSLMIETANEYNTALGKLKILSKNYELSTNEILPLSRQTLELAKKSYSLGEASYLDVIDALRSSLESRLNSIDISAGLYRSIIQLDGITGKSILNRQ